MHKLAAAFLLLCLMGCQTTVKKPASTTQAKPVSGQGQVIWKQSLSATELVADLSVEVRGDEVILQVLKGPVLFISARVNKTSWEFESPAEDRKYSGKGLPPPQISWLHLARCFGGKEPLPGWKWSVSPDGSWSFVHAGTGENFEGFFQ